MVAVRTIACKNASNDSIKSNTENVWMYIWPTMHSNSADVRNYTRRFSWELRRFSKQILLHMKSDSKFLWHSNIDNRHFYSLVLVPGLVCLSFLLPVLIPSLLSIEEATSSLPMSCNLLGSVHLLAQCTCIQCETIHFGVRKLLPSTTV